MLERKWWTLLIVCVGIFMLLLDISIVYIALPNLAQSLGASFSDLQWVIDAYALSLAALLLIAGSIGDLGGHRRTFLGGLTVFSISSLLCGLAQDPVFLIVFRAVQGIGGAAMFATSLALLAQEFRGRERGTAFGAWGATAGLAVAVGPLVGGALTSGASWRWIFLVNVPIGVLAFAATVWKVRETARHPDVRPDWPGFVALAGGLVGVVYGLIRGNPDGWGSAGIVAAFAGGFALLAVFVVLELRRPQPMLDLRLFRVPAIAGASIGAFAISAALFSMFLYFTLYLQDILHYSALQTGLRFLPFSVLALVFAPISGRASAHLPLRVLLGLGLLLIAAGLMLITTTVDTTSGWTALLAGFVVSGVGSGITNPALASAAVGTVPPDQAGIGSGIGNTSRQVGIAVGIAGLGSIFQSRVHDVFVHDLSQRAPQLAGRASLLAGSIAEGGGAQSVRGHGLSGSALRAVEQSARSAFVSGFDRILWVAAAAALAGAVLSLALVRTRDLSAAHRGQEDVRRREPRRPGGRVTTA